MYRRTVLSHKNLLKEPSWNMWVATNIHLDQSSLLRKQWYPLHWVPREEGKACLLNMNLGELLALLEKLHYLVCGRFFMNLLLAWGWPVPPTVVSRFRWGIAVGTIVGLQYLLSLVNLLLLDRRCWGRSGCSAVSFCASFEQIVKKMNFVVWEITLQALFGGTVVRNYLWYSDRDDPPE